MSNLEYKHIEPSSNNIRLLRLFKARRYYDDSPVRCELYEAPLPLEDEHDGTYEALSYTWGDPEQTVEIVVNNKHVPITANLHEALHHLRLPDQDRILWVDAICIDQKDDYERTHQVAKMGFIYKKAKEVIIWLGSTTPKIDLLLATVQTLDKRVRLRPKRRDDPEPLKIWQDEGHFLLADMKRSNPDFYTLRQQALEELIQRPWFRRVWVVQEAANASRAIIQCSWTAVPTRAFALMPSLLGLTTESRSQALLEVMPGPLRQHSWWNNDRSLCTLLQKFSHCESSDSRDQIFALLGIAFDSERPGASLQPDYQVDLRKAIQRTVTFLAFGEIVDDGTYSLPLWDLDEFRSALPSLRHRLFEWALHQDDSIALARKLVLENPRVDVNTWLRNKQNPLHYLISTNRSIEMIRLLLERMDLDIHRPQGDYTPLSRAAECNQCNVIEALLSRLDLDVDMRDPYGSTPLERAIRAGNNKVIDLLLSTPISAHVDSHMLQSRDIARMAYAAEFGSEYAVKLLIQKGVSPDAISPSGAETALTAAVKGHHIEVVRLLLDAGADVNLSTGSSRAPLFIAATSGIWEGPIPRTSQHLDIMKGMEIVRLLASRGADLEPEGDGETPLMVAARFGQLQMAELLTSLGANLEAKAVDRELTPFWTALVFNNIEVAQLLADRGANLTVSPRVLSIARAYGVSHDVRTSLAQGEMEKIFRSG